MKLNINKIEFWIIIFFLVRLFGITNPPLETGHNWRQVTGLMVSRNFQEVDSNILYPRVDDNHGQEGIIGMEFPVLNYLHYLTSKLVDYTHWYGRLINLIVSTIGIYFYSKILSRFFSKKLVFTSTIFLLASIWFMFSRKFMADTFCISLVFIGLYNGIKYLEGGWIKSLMLYVLFTTLAILSKIPAGIYFALLFPLILSKYPLKNKVIIAISTFVPLTLTYLWYFMWNPQLSEKYGVWYNAGKSMSVGLQELITHPIFTMKNFYFNAFHSYIVFILFVIGLVLIIKNKERKIIAIFFAIGLVFSIYMMKSGFFFYHHSYYIIPFVPVMALIAGYAVSLVKKQWLFVSLIVIGVTESLLNQQHDFFLKDSSKYNLTLESVADQVSDKDDLIIINGGENPLQLYLSHRKGWTSGNDKITQIGYLNEIKQSGCKYMFIDKTKDPNFNAEPIYSDEYFSIYTLDSILKSFK